ncbi:hypothetical protein [Methanobacterium paludis]|uniref:Uncharacterized protein n=1 Tax=Methanobacterium paludis (strain DSM 25820 / JCM 18151 / SWAN1) TaxID=868131 RepID=F6D5P4_METPW|nr:hypothetical protein [Methanobacterium paludis]AEG18226.1 hypothetical protein MSWAN_1209 [Methanobacterium paludis]
MISKKELVDSIEKTELEKVQGIKDIWEKYIYLNKDNVLIVGYKEEEVYDKPEVEEENIKNYYWYWELRDSQSWDVLFENHDKNFSFCESEMGGYTDQDRIEDVVGDIDEGEICKWSEKDWIEDISESIADEVLIWLATLKKGIL